MKNIKNFAILLTGVICLGLSGCYKNFSSLQANPNVASTSTTVPVSLILNRITSEIYNGGGVMDGIAGSTGEGPWNQVMRWNQFFVSNYNYYWGNNVYSWSNTATDYSVLKYTILMEQQAKAEYGSSNAYLALAKFFRAYNFIWLTQRVGDIPMTQAGDPTNLTPKYDLQHDVYKNCLALLDTANTMMSSLFSASTANTVVDKNGDIFGLTYLQWQKVINTYKLRVLISLSKRAVDNADLNIPGQFANIINNPTQYPIMTGNGDNMQFKYNSVTSHDYYPLYPNYTPYPNYADICNTFLNITTANQDPRTFIAATPARNQIKVLGKSISDFTAYVGADIGIGQGQLKTNSDGGSYSFINYLRYEGGAGATTPNVSGSTCEPYIVLGYPELCFNIAEAANRGWINGGGKTWYNNGINASLGVYGLTDGQVLNIGDSVGNPLGQVTVSVSNFLNNPNVVYAGDNATGLNQILTQKYVAFWQNSGWEAFYNWRRTGVPSFSQGGVGIGTPNNMIPIRWQYPVSEANDNSANYMSALQSQFGGTDDITKPMWLTK